MSSICINIAFPSALRKLFTYRIDPEDTGILFPGQRVVAPLKNTPTIGFVVEIDVPAPPDIKLKRITEIIDIQPLIPAELFQFLMKLSEYYLAPIGKTLSAAIPAEYRVQKNRRVFLIDDNTENVPKQYIKLFQKISNSKSLLISSLKHQFSNDILINGIARLKKLGKVGETSIFALPKHRENIYKYIVLAEDFSSHLQEPSILEKRAPRQYEIIAELQKEKAIGQENFSRFTASAIKSLLKKGLVRIKETEKSDDSLWDNYHLKEKMIQLTAEQTAVFQLISKSIASNTFAAFLLQGVTGSGKTEVYLQLIRKAIAQGKSALVLVPEITLTTHLASRFRGEFKDLIAIWHSHLSTSQRSLLWERIRKGKYPVVIGARSAVLLPIPSIGLIIIDEEQDTSFKQREQDPKYHARDAALMRAVRNHAVVVMGSATPSLESLYNAAAGKFQKLELVKRYSAAPAANVDIIDLTAEWKATGNYNSPISRQLNTKIAEKLAKGEQILLLQNRRGYSNIILCPDCGWSPRCRNCDISLTYHRKTTQMLCHYCNMTQRPPSVCPQCNSDRFLFPGFGTQRIEALLQESFPNATCVRMDIDTTRKRGFSQNVMRDFEHGKIDLIIGTQMIAKGLDFPNVTLVGVLNADIGLFMPDFRARERVFQLLYQVAGRAGRGKIQGEVLIQTLNPQDITIRYATQQNLAKFTALELAERNPINYPPFSRIVAVLVSGFNHQGVQTAAARTTATLKKFAYGMEILGPSPAAISKIKNRYRYISILKSRKTTDPNGTKLHRTLQNFLKSRSYQDICRQVQLDIDIDPLDLL